jgi:two-component system, chemotaxis family, sensor kinase CheA
LSFFSEERASELKELFFESAQELLQALNEEGLQLEKRPGDAETIRDVRRTVHTLKGDAAACGYRELSELAHELENIFTPELAATANGAVAEVVLTAADIFQLMLAAYRTNNPPPSGDPLRRHIQKLIAGPKEVAPQSKLEARFAWTEYEQMMIADALSKGESVFNIAIAIDPHCNMKAAAVQLVRNVLHDAGTLLAMVPDESLSPENIDVMEAAVSSTHDERWFTTKCRIPSAVSDILVQRQAAPAIEAVASAPPEADILDLTPVTAPTEQPQHDIPVSTDELTDAEAASVQRSLQTVAENTLRVEAERIDAVLNLVGELIIGKSMLLQGTSEFDKRFPKDPLRGKFADAMAFQARVLNDLQKSVMKIRMVPVEQLFRRIPRIVRDVAKAQNKEVGITVHGQDTDLDKSILDALAEPLIHLVRNAVDHGIETPTERVAAGKPMQGTLRLNAYHQGNQVVIEIGDDGRGIDKAKVVARAIEHGILTADDASRLTEGEALSLIFHPGLSTAVAVTEISGRGVGMDIVKSVLDRLKGTVTIQTTPGQGTTFQLKVPLTLAIIKALLFRVAERMYAVPLQTVVEIARANESEIHKVDNHEVLRLREQLLTLVRLGKINRRGKAASSKKKVFVVVIAIGDRKFGLVVDKLVGEEELVIKALDDHLVATELVSGASILGDGTVVLILNTSSVVERFGRTQAAGASA